MSVVLVVDTTQIQPYVFGSNRLRENVGASHLVAQATGPWAIERLKTHAGKLVYAGGGNVVARFEHEPDATAFIRALSEKALQDAPRLRLVMATHPIKGDNLAEAIG